MSLLLSDLMATLEQWHNSKQIPFWGKNQTTYINGKPTEHKIEIVLKEPEKN